MLIDEIKKANIEAMKARDTSAKNIYGIVMNKWMIQEIEKRTTQTAMTDADMVQILQKTIKELGEEEENYKKVNNALGAANAQAQAAALKKFLPQMLSEQEVKNIISKMPDKSIGTVMKLFKTEYAGKVDMRVVQEVLRIM